MYILLLISLVSTLPSGEIEQLGSYVTLKACNDAGKLRITQLQEGKTGIQLKEDIAAKRVKVAVCPKL